MSRSENRLDEILKALYELVAPGDITADRVFSVVGRHPELLTPDAAILGRSIANIQTSVEAKKTMEQVVELLNRCRLIGVWPAITEHRRNLAREQLRQRFR